MASESQPSLPLVLFSGGYDRVHYGLAMATAAAASDHAAAVFFTGRSLPALLVFHGGVTPGWHTLDPADDGQVPVERDAALAARGVARLEELLQVCGPLGVPLAVCEMAVRASGLPPSPPWRTDLPVRVTGLVTFLNEHCRERSPVFV